ncbi:MAG: metallophosphoesterase [Actinomycetota bacterium]|nr:metallophosphoesterase [Actinomycetota bacterium]
MLRGALGAVFGGALLGGLVYAREVEPADVEVVSVSLVLPHLDERFEGYRIALVSDLHADGWMTPGRVLGLVDLVNAEEPDLIALTGDFATYSRLRSLIRYVPDLVAPLRRLRAPDGTLAVLGNHDHETNSQVVRYTLAAAGVAELNNTILTVQRHGASLHLCGVDSTLDGAPRLDLVLQNLSQEGAAILLAHEPDFADESAAMDRFDLQLSGHSHGGQVRLPVLGAQPLLPKLGRRYTSGLYKVGGMFLYTNRGLGNHPRFRFNCRPEITILTLKAPENSVSTGRSPWRQI